MASIGAITFLRRRAGSILVIAMASAAIALFTLPVETIPSPFGDLPNGLPNGLLRTDSLSGPGSTENCYVCLFAALRAFPS